MAILLNQTLYNLDVIRYHRIAEIKMDMTSDVATAVLVSFRTEEQRALLVAPVLKREFAFIRSGNPETMLYEAYQAILALPEWAGATSD